MRFIASQLRLLLHAKFPEAPEDDILKVVGNLLYYRYMNPPIVAPDAFDVVDVAVEKQLSPDQVPVTIYCVCKPDGSYHMWLSMSKSGTIEATYPVTPAS